MPIKWMLFGLFLWLGVSMLCAIVELHWVSDTETALLSDLANGFGIGGWATTGLTAGGAIGMGIAGLILGKRSYVAVSLVCFAGFLASMWRVFFFDYPSIFYGDYQIVRWIFVVLGVGILGSVALAYVRGIPAS